MSFCGWLGGKTGLSVILPTEMQWQWAAQGNDGREYPYGPKFDPKKCNTSESKIGKTTNVDQYPNGKSPFGVVDMAGNVFEWCLSKYDNPKDSDPDGDTRRVVRGGSWHNNLYFARAAPRGYSRAPADRLDFIGFRLAVSVPV